MLPEQLLNIGVAQGIAGIPGDRLQDQRRLEVPAFEVVLDRHFSFVAIALRIMGRPLTTERQSRPQA